MASLNLQRNSEVFLSTVDIINGAAITDLRPTNTWKLEVLAGFAMTSSAATQDITSLESGITPDRSQQRFNTAINPVDWNFQVYLRPTGVLTGAAANTTTAATNQTGNVKPVADWFMWQSLVSNTKVTGGSDGTADERSVWATGGKLRTTNVAAGTGSHSTRSNFSTAVENHLYFKLDNVIYQVSNATVNGATVDAGIEEIATTTWSGFGTTMKELTGTPRDVAISCFGGVLNSGSSVTANSNFQTMSHTATVMGAYHPYNQMNVAGVSSTNSFIKNRLSAIEFHHKASAGASDEKFVFPVTALSFDYNNNITYLTPEELSSLNEPIGQFTGTRTVSGSATMYLRTGDLESAGFLRNISEDSRTSSAQTSNANLIIGGTTAPYVAFQLDACQFEFPTIGVEDVVSMTVNFLAQETTANKGDGGEVTIFAAK
jgi:hypothetical protein|tara:strand:- start:4743 stop:6035 length:1293 start_codon:yes stop_codon:yes gene_type:complete